MKRSFAVLSTCLALTLAATGCGGDDEEDTGASGGATTTEQPAGGSGGGGGAATMAVEVGMEGIAFDPEEVTVKTGGTVTWTNNESVPHDVTKEDGPGPDFSSGEAGGMNEGDTFEQTFDTAGEITYVCTIHPNMTGTVTVK